MLLTRERVSNSIRHVSGQRLFWSECTTGCCLKAKSRLVGILDRDDEHNLVCFDLNFVDGNPEQRYVFLTPFNTAFAYYLTMAQKFLGDTGAHKSFAGEVVWRIEDDATMNPSLQATFSAVGVASVGHSVHRVRGMVPMYTTLVPNFHFVEHSGYSALSQLADTSSSHLKSLRRSVFWAGSTTGIPCRGRQPCEMKCVNLQRVQLVELAQEVEWLNCSVTSAIQWCASDESKLLSSKMMSERVDEHEWMEHRGIIDIDGNVDAWGSRWRFATRSVVFKVESDYVNIYSSSLTDGVHFIGLRANLTDLRSKTAIIMTNDTDTLNYLENITENARRTIAEFSYKSEVVRVAQALKTFFDKDQALEENSLGVHKNRLNSS